MMTKSKTQGTTTSSRKPFNAPEPMRRETDKFLEAEACRPADGIALASSCELSDCMCLLSDVQGYQEQLIDILISRLLPILDRDSLDKGHEMKTIERRTEFGQAIANRTFSIQYSNHRLQLILDALEL